MEGSSSVRGTFQDITERKQAEEKLSESEERFRLVSQATRDYIWDWERTANRVWRNERFYERFGPLGPGEDPLDYWLQRIHPDDRERVLTRATTAVEGGEPYWTSEYRLRGADGDYAYVIDRGYAVRDAQGATDRAVGAIQDITDRKRAEDEVRKSQERLELALEGAGLGMLGPEHANRRGHSQRAMGRNAWLCTGGDQQ